MKRKLLLWLFLLAVTVCAKAQTRTLTGKVTDHANASPLPGVSIKVKGTNNGTSTTADGTFRINVPENAKVLVFSFLGYETTEKNIGGLSNLSVSLSQAAQGLTEYVMVGYGTQSKLAQTGAISQISGKQVENIPLPSVDKILQGKIAGLQSLGGSGQPGAIQQIRIRGIGSINSSAAPLFVVDGVPINAGDLSRNTTTANSLAGLNPNDIESISVLKDAASSSIYGSRAANGVILITTKGGKAGKTRIRADAEYGFAKPILRDANRPLNASEWRNLTAEGFVNAGFDADMTSALKDVDESFGSNNGVNTNWLDVVTRTGQQMQYNLSADGGNDKTQFHVSGGYFKQEGTVIASSFDRVSGSFNIKHKLNDRITFGSSLIASSSRQRGPTNGGTFANPVLAAYFLLPHYSPYKPDGTPNFSSDPNAEFGPGGTFNPIAIAAMDNNRNSTLKAIGSIWGEYEILPNLKFTTKYGVDYNNLEELGYQNPLYGDGFADHGISTVNYTRYFNWVWTNMLNYRWDIKKDNQWVVNVKAGYEAQKSKLFFSTTETRNLPSRLDVQLGAAGSRPTEASAGGSDYSFASVLALGDVTYKGKYVLSGSFRRDGSSRFGSDNRYGNFWSVGGSWNVDQEDFLKDISWLDQLKVRASYGQNGNANFGTYLFDYVWRSLYGYGKGTDTKNNAYNFNYEGAVGSAPLSAGNNALTWEVNKPFDIGVDFSVFKRRLNASVEYYTRTTSSLLMEQPLSRTSGFQDYLTNIGSIRNKGIEITLSGTPVIAGDFRWDASFTFAHNKNEVVSLASSLPQISGQFIRQVGSDYQTFYVRQWAGVDKQNGDALWYKDDTHKETTNSYSQAKRVALGSASPKYFGSFGSTFSFKGFSLDGLLYYNFGNYVQDLWARYLQGDGFAGAFNKMAPQLNRWQKPGDETDVPKYVFNGNKNSNEMSSRFLYKGDYIRLRDVTLSYTFPQAWLNHAKISSLRVYVRGTNIWTWVKDKNITSDPEASIASQSNLEVFMPKIYTVGINLGL
ncbi:MAG TPA: TonB-dependent receptor [Chitinophaga sp.]|uniref:SusC/RagA family TonB-linked outer membrane protein n=1 Tax=Chitinophaga sp. TaxID=1869181 RepID=UPI002CE06B06|nr:TonB-dependent receptor [Chitinophaga sp.]HVI48746.1 TonB-dependent receptor [Chitinophaga sp.]